MFFKGPIARRVNAVMKQRIADAEAKYQAKAKTIKEETEAEIAEVQIKAEGRRLESQDELVHSVLGN